MVAVRQLDTITNETIHVADAPAIPGLFFRRFRGQADYPAMLAVIEASKGADGVERTDTLDEITNNYEHLTNCDPHQDMLFVEVHGNLVGYSRVWWYQDLEGQYFYPHFSFLVPGWRNKGLRRAMVRFSEQRLREIALDHRGGPHTFETWASDSEVHWENLLKSEGYEGVRFGFSMVRPNLEDIPSHPLPDGLEVRPVKPDQYLTVWEAVRESFRGEWGYSEDEWSAEQFLAWQKSPSFTPDLWQVAWHEGEVAGTVLNFINDEENREYKRKRGYTETISVRRPFRRRGLARALVARSFQVLRERGMEEAALGVDTQNPNHALQLYKSMGFRPVQRHATYRKPMA